MEMVKEIPDSSHSHWQGQPIPIAIHEDDSSQKDTTLLQMLHIKKKKNFFPPSGLQTEGHIKKTEELV